MQEQALLCKPFNPKQNYKNFIDVLLVGREQTSKQPKPNGLVNVALLLYSILVVFPGPLATSMFS